MTHMDATPAQRRRQALRDYMAKNGLNLNNWAVRAGASESALRGFLSGRTESLNIDTYERLAAAENVPIERLLPPRQNSLMEGGGSFADHPDVAAASEARAHKLDIARAITAEPELFAALLGKYRQLYQEEGVAITEEELAILTLNDYAQLIIEFDTTEERRQLAKGFIVKQRGWLRQNNGAIKSGT